MTGPTTNDPQPAITRHPRKGSDHDTNQHSRAEATRRTAAPVTAQDVPGDDPTSGRRDSVAGSATTPESASVPRPRQGTPTRRSQPGAQRANRRRADSHVTQASETVTADLTDAMPTPEQWAQEQLTHAPPRSRAWARTVVTIYGLELPDT